VTPAEVYGTATFYEMFKFEPVGRYCVNICTNISCQLLGAWELLDHAEEALGVKAGGTTADRPSRTTPSTGTRFPGLTRTRSPARRSATS